jgi:hypothetical protein
MADQHPDYNLPPVSDESGFPWVIFIFIVVALGGAAWWFLSGKSLHQGQATAVAALDQQLITERAALDAERQKAVDMSKQLEAMKRAIQLRKVHNLKQAKADYAKLQAAYQAQAEKVKTLTAQYKEKVNNLQKLH